MFRNTGVLLIECPTIQSRSLRLRRRRINFSLGEHRLVDVMTPTGPDPQFTNDRPLKGRRGRRTSTRIGIVLILLSGVLWFSLFAIPFLPLTVGQRAALAGVVFVGVQIAWWSGAALAGRQTVARLWPRRGVTKTDDS